MYKTDSPLGFDVLFNFEGLRAFKTVEQRENTGCLYTRGCSSVGRVPALQAGGRQFESVHLHQQVGRQEGTPGLATEMGS